MHISLAQFELEAAVATYLQTVENINLDGRKLEITFTAGRNPPNYTAEIDVFHVENEQVEDLSEVPEMKDAAEESPGPFGFITDLNDTD